MFSELLLHYRENTKIINILLQYNAIGYFCYVDNILIVYNTDTTNIYNVLNNFNNVMPTMNFTIEEEKDNKINFLNITISKENKSLSFNIYRKPTTTDTIIPYNSCHPLEQKLAAIRYITNRNKTYILNAQKKTETKGSNKSHIT
jgi:hypothetical protein